MTDITDAAASEQHDRLRDLFRLTDAEREAIDQAYCSIGRDDSLGEKHAETLRETLLGILLRFGGEQ